MIFLCCDKMQEENIATMISDDDTESSEILVPRRQNLIRRFLSVITLEPFVFLQILGYGLYSVIYQNLMIDKVCLVNLNFTKEICQDLTHHKKYEEQVQEIVADLQMYLSILSSIPAIITGLFLGPWSDANGRKPLMIVPCIGDVLGQVVLILNTYFGHIKAEYILIYGACSIFGGFTSLLIGMYGYISDISDQESRTSRIALIDLSMAIGVPIGFYSSGPLFQYGGYYTVFGLTAFVKFLGILYLVIMIKDTRGGTISNENDFIQQDESMNNCLGAFSISNVIKVFKTCFKKRSGYIRGIILLLILTMLFNMGTDSSNLIYLFTRLKLDWDEQYYAVFAAVASGATSLFTFAFITISSYGLNVHDTVIGITGALFGLLGRLTYAFASKTWMMYLGAAIGLLSSTPSITIRSALSKVTPSNELGAIFSLLASLEAATPLVLAPLYTFVYNQTLDVFPGAIMVLQAGIYFLAIMTFVIIYFLFKKSFNNDEENLSIIENEENVAVDDTED